MSKVVRDITERKKTEEALRRREQQLEEAQSLAQMGSFEWNIVENTFHFSTELYRMYDLPPASEATFETAMARAILTTVSKSLTPRVEPLEGPTFGVRPLPPRWMAILQSADRHDHSVLSFMP